MADNLADPERQTMGDPAARTARTGTARTAKGTGTARTGTGKEVTGESMLDGSDW